MLRKDYEICKIGLITVDMDGMLPDSHQKISSRNLKAIREGRLADIQPAIYSEHVSSDLFAYMKEYALDYRTDAA